MINPQRAEIALTLTQSKRTSIESQLRTIFSALLESQVGSSTFTSLITQLMNGNSSPLAEAMVNRRLTQEKENIRQSLPNATQQDVEQMLSADGNTFDRFARHMVETAFADDRRQVETEVARVRDIVEAEKSQLRVSLQTCRNLEAHCVRLGMGKDATAPDLRHTCLWVPANVRHNTPGHSARLVYGGVLVDAAVREVKSDTLQGQLAHQHVFQNPQHEGITVDYFVYRTQTEVPPEIRQELGNRTLMYYYRLTTETQKEEAKARAEGKDVQAIYREVAAELEAKKRQPATASAPPGNGGDSSDSSGDEGGNAPMPQTSAPKHSLKHVWKNFKKKERVPWRNAVIRFVTQKAFDEGWSLPYTVGVNVTDVITAEEITFVRFHETWDKKYDDPNAKSKKDKRDDDKIGRFIVREKEIRHIINDPKALREYLALRYEPAFMSTVVVPAGTRIRVGLIAPQPKLGIEGNKGKFQYEWITKIPSNCFKDTKPILKPANNLSHPLPGVN